MEQRPRILEAHRGEVVGDQWKVSPSQITMFGRTSDSEHSERVPEGCPRKWGFKYIEGIPDPAGAGARFGTATHKQLADFFAEGKTIDVGVREGRVASAGLHLFPFLHDAAPYRASAEIVEAPFWFVADGITFRGVIDLGWRTGPKNWTISDHKTSKDPRAWGLTAEKLPTDPQALTYATWALAFYDLQMVQLQWTYFRTQGTPEAYAVETELQRDQALANFEEIVMPVARDIIEARDNVRKAVELPINPSQCGKFGGCPYAAMCPRSTENIVAAVFGTQKKEQKKMGVLDRLKNGRRPAPKPEELQARNVNSPEAPKDVETEGEISRAVEGKTRDEARDVVEAWKESPSKEQVMARVREGQCQWVVSKKKATKDLPYVHTRTLNALVTDGSLVGFEKDEDGVVTISAKRETNGKPLRIVSQEDRAPKTKVLEVWQEEDGTFTAKIDLRSFLGGLG